MRIYRLNYLWIEYDVDSSYILGFLKKKEKPIFFMGDADRRKSVKVATKMVQYVSTVKSLWF